MSCIAGSARTLCSLFLIVLFAAGAAAQVPGATPGDSATLSRMVARVSAQVRASDPGVRAASARELAAERRMAAAGFAPPLSASFDVADAPRGDLVSGNMTAEISRDLWLGPRLAAARSAASSEHALAVRERGVAELTVDVRVSDLLVNGAAASRALTRLRQSERLLAEAEDALTVRFAAGGGRYADVLRVRTERLTVGFSIRGELANLAAVRAQLLAISGLAAGDSLNAWIETTAAALGDSSAWRGMIQSLPSIDSLLALGEPVRDAAAALVRAESRRLEGRASRRPAVSAAVGIQRIGEANGGPSAGLTFGIASTLPFSARGANYRADEADVADVTAADAALAAARARARPTLEALRERLTAAFARLEAIDGVLLAAAASEREAALAEFRTGALTLIELIDFERALLRVEIERTHALRQAAGLRAALFGVTPHESGVTP